MNRTILLILAGFGLAGQLLSQTTYRTPVRNGLLEGPLDAAGETIRWPGGLYFGNSPNVPTSPSLIHFQTATTDQSGGIMFHDVALYRQSSGTLRISGALNLTGNLSAPNLSTTTQPNTWLEGQTYADLLTAQAGITMQNLGITFDAAAALATRTSLGLVPGTDVAVHTPALASFGAITPGSGEMLVGNGTIWVAQGGGTLRTSLGLGTGSNVTFTNVTASGTLNVTGAQTFSAAGSWPNATTSGTAVLIGGIQLYASSGTLLTTNQGLDAAGASRIRSNLRLDGELGFAGDSVANLKRTGAGQLATDGSLTVAGTITGGALSITSPIGTASGGTGLNNGSLAANQMLYTSGTGIFSSTSLTAHGRQLAGSADATATRSLLSLGGAALLNVGTGAGTVAAGDDVRLTDTRVPSGAAGGSLTGTYPNPTVANDSITLATHTTGNYIATLAGANGIEVTGSGVENATVTIQNQQNISTTSSPTFAGLTVTGLVSFSSTSSPDARVFRQTSSANSGTFSLEGGTDPPNHSRYGHILNGVSASGSAASAALTVQLPITTGLLDTPAARQYGLHKTGTGWALVTGTSTQRFNVGSDGADLNSGAPLLLLGARQESVQLMQDSTANRWVVTSRSRFRTASTWTPADTDQLDWLDDGSIAMPNTSYMTEYLYVDLRSLTGTQTSGITLPAPSAMWRDHPFRLVSVATNTTHPDVTCVVTYTGVNDAGAAVPASTVTLRPISKPGGLVGVLFRCVERGGTWGWVPQEQDQAPGLDIRTSRVVDTDQTLTSLDNVVLLDSGDDMLDVTLPAASAHPNQVFTLVKLAGETTISLTGADELDGSATPIVLDQTGVPRQSRTVLSDGTGWYTIGAFR